MKNRNMRFIKLLYTIFIFAGVFGFSKYIVFAGDLSVTPGGCRVNKNTSVKLTISSAAGHPFKVAYNTIDDRKIYTQK